jgi:hypothetical protein
MARNFDIQDQVCDAPDFRWTLTPFPVEIVNLTTIPTAQQTGELEMRLKTIQIRLAGMSDQLNALSGRDPEQGPDADLILELNDW